MFVLRKILPVVVMQLSHFGLNGTIIILFFVVEIFSDSTCLKISYSNIIPVQRFILK